MSAVAPERLDRTGVIAAMHAFSFSASTGPNLCGVIQAYLDATRRPTPTRDQIAAALWNDTVFQKANLWGGRYPDVVGQRQKFLHRADVVLALFATTARGGVS